MPRRHPQHDHAPLGRLLIGVARRGLTVSYAKIAKECGGIARGQGQRLNALTQTCHDRALPLLPILVVNQSTRLPSVNAEIYQRLGLTSRAAILAEQQRCFAHDWTDVTFGRSCT